MQEQSRIRVVGVLIDMIDAVGVKRARPPDKATDLIAFGEQELGQIGAILTGDSSNQRFFVISYLPFSLRRNFQSLTRPSMFLKNIPQLLSGNTQ